MRERILLASGIHAGEMLCSLALHGVNIFGLGIFGFGELAPSAVGFYLGPYLVFLTEKTKKRYDLKSNT